MKAIAVGALTAVGFAAIVAVFAGGEMHPVLAANGEVVETAVDASGNLHVPKGYRTTYQLLGTWAVASDQDPGSQELHVIYASPGTLAAYRKDGHFPDGAILVKEVYRAATAEMTTGTVSHADTLRGWFVMVRDRSGRHAENQTWGVTVGAGPGLMSAIHPLRRARFRCRAAVSSRPVTSERTASPATHRRKRRNGSMSKDIRR